MPDVVCQGASCKCPVGTATSKLIVTSQQRVKIDGKLVATTADCVPATNLPPFGTCNTLTASASGVTTPCALVPVGTWVPGSTRTTINELPVLTQASTLVCGVGGIIVITDPNNDGVGAL